MSTSSNRIIFIIRHGEKPGDPPPPHGVDRAGNQNQATDEHCLIPKGWQRAGALVSFFAPFDGHLRRGIATPSELISPGYQADTPNHRTHQTIYPLSKRLGIDIDTSHQEGGEHHLGTLLAKNTAGGVTLVCWEHQRLPTIATAIAPHAKIATTWPDDRFDVVWSFAYDGSDYIFTQVPQMLLHKDSEAPICPT